MPFKYIHEARAFAAEQVLAEPAPKQSFTAPGESIINALTPSTEHVATPLWLQPRASLRGTASALQDIRSGPSGRGQAVDDKAEVSESPKDEDARLQRQLQYDEAVNQAFPDDMYSQQLSNGLPGKQASKTFL